MAFYSSRSFFALVATAALGVLPTACGQQDSQGDSTATSLASELVAAQGSLAASEAEAESCFQSYETCAATDTKAVCREQLAACLPTEAVEPGERQQRCDGGASASGERGEPSNEEAKSGDKRQHGDGGEPTAERGERSNEARVQRSDAGSHSPPRGDFDACRSGLDNNLEQDKEPKAAFDGHRDCVRQAFGRIISELCQRAQEACSVSNAPAEACGKIVSLCSADAGTRR